jgi:hypothetical protein
MSKWKYGTILRDDDNGGFLMVVREIDEKSAGEKDLYEAIRLDAEPGGEFYAISPKDKDLTEIMDANDPNVIVMPGVKLTRSAAASGTWSGTLTFSDPPPPGNITITYDER